MNEGIRQDPRALIENEKHCVICSKFFTRRGVKKHTAKYCSQKCHGLGDRGKQSKKKRHKFIQRICGTCRNEFSSWAKAKFCSRQCYFDAEHKSVKGENHWNWKGGITPKNQIERKSKRYARWRKKVFERDDFTCQDCAQKGRKLEAHHIKAWAKYPKLRFITNNGKTLCKKCHEKTDNYKRGRKQV